MLHRVLYPQVHIDGIKKKKAKLNEYYQHSGASNAHLITMGKPSITASCILTNTAVVLNPISEMNHFKQWSQDLVSEVKDAVCACVCIPLYLE